VVMLAVVLVVGAVLLLLVGIPPNPPPPLPYRTSSFACTSLVRSSIVFNGILYSNLPVGGMVGWWVWLSW